MQRIIREYLENAELASSPNELRDAVAQLIRPLDFNAFAFLALSDKGSPPILVSNYDERWQTHYIAQGYQRRDPVMLHSRGVADLFSWGRGMAAKFGSLAEDFFYEAETFDIRSGVTVPIPDWPGGFAAMTFATDQRHVHLTSCLRCYDAALLFLTAHFQSHLQWILEPVRRIEDAELTAREYVCLRWVAAGKSQPDISQITGISLRTVARDIENLRAKLGVRSITQAVSIFATYEATKNKRMH
jgi:DNA-binding CsgD family transcriptional regulator